MLKLALTFCFLSILQWPSGLFKSYSLGKSDIFHSLGLYRAWSLYKLQSDADLWHSISLTTFFRTLNIKVKTLDAVFHSEVIGVLPCVGSL